MLAVPRHGAEVVVRPGTRLGGVEQPDRRADQDEPQLGNTGWWHQEERELRLGQHPCVAPVAPEGMIEVAPHQQELRRLPAVRGPVGLVSEADRVGGESPRVAGREHQDQEHTEQAVATAAPGFFVASRRVASEPGSDSLASSSTAVTSIRRGCRRRAAICTTLARGAPRSVEAGSPISVRRHLPPDPIEIRAGDLVRRIQAEHFDELGDRLLESLLRREHHAQAQTGVRVERRRSARRPRDGSRPPGSSPVAGRRARGCSARTRPAGRRGAPRGSAAPLPPAAPPARARRRDCRAPPCSSRLDPHQLGPALDRLLRSPELQQGAGEAVDRGGVARIDPDRFRVVGHRALEVARRVSLVVGRSEVVPGDRVLPGDLDGPLEEQDRVPPVPALQVREPRGRRQRGARRRPPAAGRRRPSRSGTPHASRMKTPTSGR